MTSRPSSHATPRFQFLSSVMATSVPRTSRFVAEREQISAPCLHLTDSAAPLAHRQQHFFSKLEKKEKRQKKLRSDNHALVGSLCFLAKLSLGKVLTPGYRHRRLVSTPSTLRLAMRIKLKLSRERSRAVSVTVLYLAHHVPHFHLPLRLCLPLRRPCYPSYS